MEPFQVSTFNLKNLSIKEDTFSTISNTLDINKNDPYKRKIENDFVNKNDII